MNETSQKAYHAFALLNIVWVISCIEGIVEPVNVETR